MFSFFKKAPATEPYICSNRHCGYKNAEKSIAGTYYCQHCFKGTYLVPLAYGVSPDVCPFPDLSTTPNTVTAAPPSSQKTYSFDPNAMVRSPPRQEAVNYSTRSRDHCKTAAPSSSQKAYSSDPNAMVRSSPRQETVNRSAPRHDRYKAEQRMAKKLDSWGKPLSRSNATKRMGSGDSQTTSSTYAHAYGHSNISSRQYAHSAAHKYSDPVQQSSGYPYHAAKY
ncbi:hypothetical protein Moror_4382 [Moniliophthora roreri MCA 2997]|uniref:Uncharacterized protein n=1 Tax=Moniliophthora roreri (strain MCA 2997) TaxID=1381753 RepID=V2X0D3_MONRO|nr:hypothetical protein Moror_4382 [Moniliophthora roreri MCA 2997]